MKSKKTRIGIAIGLFFMMLLLLFGFSTRGREDERAFQDVVLGLELQMETGVIPAETLVEKLGGNSSVNEAQIVKEAEEVGQLTQVDYDQYFSSNLAEKYDSIHEEKMQNVELERVTVGSGVLNAHLISSEAISEMEKKIKISYVNWISCIENQEGVFAVTLIMNRDTEVIHTVFEDDVWKTVESDGDGYLKEFAPDDYMPIRGTFDTFQEALLYAENLDVESENPFV